MTEEVARYITSLETALQNLLECFEPTDPPTFMGVDDIVTVNADTEAIIEDAWELLDDSNYPLEDD